MRWESQRVSNQREQLLPLVVDTGASARGTGRAGLAEPGPGPVAAGTEDALAIEVQAKSIINRVPGGAGVPFRWTINPYRGCSHACRYCFARSTHTYLDFDSGHDFDRAARSWSRSTPERWSGWSWRIRAGRAKRSRWAPTPTRTSAPRASTA
ncbi:hypothetical protein GCM10027271_50500 [Saccharopolyspora gloriosae]|uniref:Radical SAM protein n=1 Tax=Saccharopolyspora gloriosae TaxID=455344 RepID=A0A840NGJ8_9PSEU|nr:hypothetical protein [Saccharopolyspora gloriosae]